MTECQQCGMHLTNGNDYHPYPACVMMRQVRNGDKVESYLKQIIEWGRKLERLDLPDNATVADVVRAEKSQ